MSRFEVSFMQIIHLPEMLMLLSFVLVWPLFQVSASWLCLLIPLEKLDYTRGLFKSRIWESRAFYCKFFKVNLWKKYLPDGAGITNTGFAKKHLVGADPAYLSRFLNESCRAELGHWLAILPFWVFGLWAPPIVLPLMLFYALAVNLPCIIAQRYNRPRIAKLLVRVQTPT
jgi:glycosyl-4,4'-diaponeurosporenoate acyltransferase